MSMVYCAESAKHEPLRFRVVRLRFCCLPGKVMAKLLPSSALVALLLPIVTLAETAPPPDRAEPPQTPELRKPDEFLPSRSVMDRLLQRWTYEVATQYNFDERQREKATTEVLRRWGRFFDENRRSIETLFSQYLQMRLRLEPPDKSHVRDWAHRAAPLLAKLRNHIEHGVAAVREILEPHQRARFERQVQAFRQGLDDVEARLGRLEKGEFSPDDFLDLFEPPERAAGQRRGQHTSVQRRVEAEAAKDRVEIEIDAWRAYVESFMVTHRLDPGQRNAARSMLSEMCGRAGAHRDGRRDEIETLERRIESFSGSKTDLVELKKQLGRLYGPFDAMFRELERRLLTILTAEQRARMEETKPAGDDGEDSDEQQRDH